MPVAPDFGTCWGTPNGQDLSMPSYMASGWQCVAEAIARRWGTSRGALIDDPNYGQSAMDLVSDDLSAADLAYYRSRFAAEAKKDARVLRATVQLDLAADGTLTLTGQITTAKGPFTMVVAVSATTVQLLQVTPL